MQKLESGELPQSYSSYPTDVINTVKEESQGLIDIALPEQESNEETEEEMQHLKFISIKQRFETKKKNLKELKKLKKKLFSDKQFKILRHYNNLLARSEQLLNALRLNKKSLDLKENEITAYAKKEEQLKKLKLDLEGNIPQEEQSRIREKIARLQIRLSKRDLSKLLQEKAEIKEKLDEIVNSKEKLDGEIERIKKIMITPQSCQEQIKIVQKQLSQTNDQKKTGELKEKLEKLTKQQIEARKRATNLGIQNEIKRMQSEITCFETFLRNYENGKISFRDFSALISKI